MSVCYAGSSKARFTCDALRNHLHQTQCQSLNARPLQELIQQQIFIAISPASIALSVKAAQTIQSDRAAIERHHQQAIKRAAYESELARRRYEEVDPSNRLVAGELERRWEVALQQQRAAEEELNRLRRDGSSRLTDAEVEHIQSLSKDIPALWHSPSTSPADRQTIVRALIDEVLAEVVDNCERVDVTIRWCGGYESHHEVIRAVGKFEQLESADLIKQRIIQLKRRGHCHEAIAEDLNTSGYRSAQRSAFTKAVVSQLVRQFRAAGERCEAIGGHEDYWTMLLLAEELEMSTSTLRNWQQRDWLTLIRSGQRWIIWADKEELARLTKLAEHQTGPHCRTPPAALTTPRTPN